MSKYKSDIILGKMVRYAEDSIKYIEGFSYEDFAKDEKTLVFSVFSLSQLGELVAKLDKKTRDQFHDIPWNDMKSVRNRIVHDYDGVQYRIVRLLGILVSSMSQAASHLSFVVTPIHSPEQGASRSCADLCIRMESGEDPPDRR